MTEIDLSKLLITVLTLGFGGVIGVLGFFARRLVSQQDQHERKLGDHDVRITRVETKLEAR